VNTKRYATSLSLALALGISTGALASQANHENEWSNMVSYGETTIAQDSPEDFGQWKMMVQPAAGPTGNQLPAMTPMRVAHTPNSAPIPKPTLLPISTSHTTQSSVIRDVTPQGGVMPQQASYSAIGAAPAASLKDIPIELKHR